MRKTHSAIVLLVLASCSQPSDDHPTEEHGSITVVVDEEGVARSIDTTVGIGEVTSEDVARIEGARGAVGERRTEEPRYDPTADAIAHATALPSNTIVRIGVELDAEAAQRLYEEIGETSDRAARASSIARVRDNLRPSQDAFAERAKARHGATGVSFHWLVNMVGMNVPAGAVRTIAAEPGVRVVHKLVDRDYIEEQAPADGADLRGSTGAQRLLNAGYDGLTFSLTSSIAFLETWETALSGALEDNLLNWAHVGFNSGAFGFDRMEAFDCELGSCTQTFALPTTETHGTAVTWIAAGSVNDGQDITLSLSAANERTGMTEEAFGLYYRYRTCEDVVAALEHATQNLVDIVNMSNSPTTNKSCSRTYDCGGLNAALRNNNSILLVKSAGNEGSTTGSACNVTYPGYRPEVLAVGGVDNGLDPYSDANVADNSSIGGPNVRFHNGFTTRSPAVGLMANNVIVKNFSAPGSTYNSFTGIPGTSMAAPQVVGGAVLLSEALDDFFGFKPTGARLRTQLMLMGDSWPGWNGSALDTESGFSSYTGAGRLELHYPSDDDLTTPWGWGQHLVAMSPGQTYSAWVGSSAAEPSQVTEWKWVMTWNGNPGNQLDNSSDFILEAWDVCAPGGVELVATDYTYNLRKRIRLPGSEVTGRCMLMRVIYYGGPATGGARVVYMGDYFHSGSTANH